eukprot:3031594-Rhodomonas_salina.1
MKRDWVGIAKSLFLTSFFFVCVRVMCTPVCTRPPQESYSCCRGRTLQTRKQETAVLCLEAAPISCAVTNASH